MFKRGGKKTFAKMLFSLPTFLVAIILVGSLSCLFALTAIPGGDYIRFNNQKRLMARQDLLIKEQVTAAISMLDALNQKVAKGELTKAKAQKMGADLLRDMRYGAKQEGYFFADTTDGVNVVLLGDKSTEGRNRLNDSVNGIFYVKGILEAGQKAGGGYSDYWFPKPNETVAKPKRAYSLEFKPFGWVVGTGYYLEDLK